MVTAKQIIESALRTIGVLASNEEGQPSELQDALFTLNGILGDWSNDNLLINARFERSFDLVSGKQTYSYGEGGDFDAPRPMSIELARIWDGMNYNCQNLGIVQFSELYTDTVQRPIAFYFNSQYPLAEIKFNSIPESGKFTVITVEPFEKFNNIVEPINLPSGYDRALKLALAIELAAEYNGTLKQETVALAEDAKRKIQNRNGRVDLLTFDFGFGL